MARKSAKIKQQNSMIDILCCHNAEVAVLRVQSPYLNIEQSKKNA